jgi:PDZ domain-containing protein
MDTQKSRAGRFRFSLPPRLERTLNIGAIVALVLVVVALILWHLPSSYQVLLPATAEAVDSQIYVAHHPAQSGRGRFYMTFVEEPDPNLLLSLVARLDPDASVEPLPPNYSVSQSIQQGQVDMLSSEQTAELVALCHVGYPKLCSGGVQVVQVEPYSKAGALFKGGDVITAVNGTPVASPDGLRAILSAQAPGTRFRVTLHRGKQTLTETVPTVRSPSKPYTAVFGIEVQTAPPLSLPSTLPIDMKINPGNIGGPSAGLMFALGLLNRLSPTDLTHGYAIAGTGTIGLDGSVGPIGGVKQKVIGAEWAHAKYFFVPCSYGNYTDAKKVVGKGMMLVPVNTLNDAMNFLKALGTNPHPATITCPATSQ